MKTKQWSKDKYGMWTHKNCHSKMWLGINNKIYYTSTHLNTKEILRSFKSEKLAGQCFQKLLRMSASEILLSGGGYWFDIIDNVFK